jgi:F-type H+-transporting ATPase subunit delta
MKVSKQARRQAKHLLRNCQVDGVVDESRARSTVDDVLRQRPRGFVAMLNHFQRLLKLDAQRRLARVESAGPLSAGLEAELRSTLERRYGRGLTYEFAQNPALLGGLRIQVGSDVYDGSVRSRLSEVREAFESA